MIDEEEEVWSSIESGALRLPDPFPGLVCREYPSDPTTFWSRLTYRRWPLLVLSSKELTASKFEQFGETTVSDGRVTIPPEVLRDTKWERETRNEDPPTLEDGTDVVLYTRENMQTGRPRSAYVMRMGEMGALRQITTLLPTPR